MANLYIYIFDVVSSNRSPGHGREGYYFAENGEHTLYDLAKQIGYILVKFNKSSFRDPVTFTQDEIVKYFGVGPISQVTNILTDILEARDFTRVQLKVQGKPVTSNWLVPKDDHEGPLHQCGA